MRITLALLLALSASAFAQDGGPGRGPGPRRGFDAGGPGGPGGFRFLGADPGMPGRVVTGAPYSADLVTETTHTLADGNHIKQTSTTKLYRDSEGRTRREQSVNLNGLAQSGSAPQLVFINDPVGGVNYALNAKDRTGSKSTFTPRGQGQRPLGRGPRPENAANGPSPRAFGHRNDQNVKTESLGRQTIEGVQADGTRSTLTIPAGQIGNEQPIQIVTETWYSPDLKAMVLSKHTDPRNGETVTRLMNISRSEPSPMLFQAPADYKVSETQHGPRPRQ